MILRCAVWLLCLVGWPLLAQTTVTLKLEDGGTVAGRVISFKDQYVQLATDSGGGAAVYTNVSWARLSQASLQQLAANRSAALDSMRAIRLSLAANSAVSSVK